MIFADILRTRAGIVSSPVDFDTLRLFSSVITSCSQIVRNLNNVFRWEVLLSVSLSALFSFNHWVSISEANLEPISIKKSLKEGTNFQKGGKFLGKIWPGGGAKISYNTRKR